MLFSSMIFLWVFLPIVLIIYYLINFLVKDSKSRIHAKNVFLLIASLIFYGWGGIYFLGIMIASIVINFAGGYYISNTDPKTPKKKTTILVVTIILNLAILFYFKYFNMLVVIIEQIMAKPENILTLLSNIFSMKGTGALGFKEVVLPIGISFFTFQAMSYVIDVYKGNASAQPNILDFGLYVALFPQLIAGPIVKYSDIALEINERYETVTKFERGIKRFCYGLGKKVILANTFAVVVDSIWALELNNIGCVIAWFGAIAYAFQIYYDFSGYSDMAIGLGLFFGFDFKENFNYPYMSTSIIEFWRRWHISLSTWFKEYVYIPLGGSWCSLPRTCLNIFIVFLLTGIWHGANWTFICWGIMYAALEIFERLFLGKHLENNKFKFLNWLYANLCVLLLWILFRANNISDAGIYLSQLVTLKSKYNILTFLSMKVILAFIIGFLCMGVLQKIFDRSYRKIKSEPPILVIDFIIQMLILVYSILLIVSGTYNPFIYFQF